METKNNHINNLLKQIGYKELNVAYNNDKIIMSNIKYIDININTTINIAKNKLMNKEIIFILFI